MDSYGAGRAKHSATLHFLALLLPQLNKHKTLAAIIFKVMRLPLIIALTLNLGLSFGQDVDIRKAAADERIFKQLITNRLLEKDYDLIEGIWDLKANTLTYINGQLKDAETANTKIGIIKIDNNFSIFVINKSKTNDYIEKDYRDSYYTFYRMDKDAYGILKFNSGEGRLVRFDKVVAVNKMTDNHLRNSYPSVYGSYKIDCYEEKELARVYPTLYDIQNAKTQAEEKAKEEAPRSGTGFAISKDGLIVTNYHVIANAKSIKVRGINNDFDSKYTLSIVREDIANDLVILKIDDTSVKINSVIPFIIKKTPSEVGEDIFVLGYPLTATMGEEIKLTTGIVSSKTGFQGDVNQYQISAPIQPGNSGGPVFDKKGNIVGVISSKHLDTENVGYSIKSQYLLNLIDILPQRIPNSTTSILVNKSLADQVKILKSFVFIIEVNQ